LDERRETDGWLMGREVTDAHPTRRPRPPDSDRS
jgi:hypothetical protein